MTKKFFIILSIIVAAIVSSCSPKSAKSNKPEASTVVNSNVTTQAKNDNKSVNLHDYLMQKGKIILAGKVKNDLDIHMELNLTNRNISSDIGDLYYNSSITMVTSAVTAKYEGFYYYDKYKRNIKVEGQLYSNGYFNIYEFDDKNNLNGSFGGFVFDDQLIKGMWCNKDGDPKFGFFLTNKNIKTTGLDLNLNKRRIGTYTRNGSNTNDFTTLIINTEGTNKFKFHISGYSNPNIGNVGDVATYLNVSKTKAQFYDKKTNLKIEFYFSGNTIKVTGNDVLSNYGGAHVTLSGTFKKNN